MPAEIHRNCIFFAGKSVIPLVFRVGLLKIKNEMSEAEMLVPHLVLVAEYREEA